MSVSRSAIIFVSCIVVGLLCLVRTEGTLDASLGVADHLEGNFRMVKPQLPFGRKRLLLSLATFGVTLLAPVVVYRSNEKFLSWHLKTFLLSLYAVLVVAMGVEAFKYQAKFAASLLLFIFLVPLSFSMLVSPFFIKALLPSIYTEDLVQPRPAPSIPDDEAWDVALACIKQLPRDSLEHALESVEKVFLKVSEFASLSPHQQAGLESVLLEFVNIVLATVHSAFDQVASVYEATLKDAVTEISEFKNFQAIQAYEASLLHLHNSLQSVNKEWTAFKVSKDGSIFGNIVIDITTKSQQVEAFATLCGNIKSSLELSECTLSNYLDLFKSLAVYFEDPSLQSDELRSVLFNKFEACHVSCLATFSDLLKINADTLAAESIDDAVSNISATIASFTAAGELPLQTTFDPSAPEVAKLFSTEVATLNTILAALNDRRSSENGVVLTLEAMTAVDVDSSRAHLIQALVAHVNLLASPPISSYTKEEQDPITERIVATKQLLLASINKFTALDIDALAEKKPFLEELGALLGELVPLKDCDIFRAEYATLTRNHQELEASLHTAALREHPSIVNAAKGSQLTDLWTAYTFLSSSINSCSNSIAKESLSSRLNTIRSYVTEKFDAVIALPVDDMPAFEKKLKGCQQLVEISNGLSDFSASFVSNQLKYVTRLSLLPSTQPNLLSLVAANKRFLSTISFAELVDTISQMQRINDDICQETGIECKPIPAFLIYNRCSCILSKLSLLIKAADSNHEALQEAVDLIVSKEAILSQIDVKARHNESFSVALARAVERAKSTLSRLPASLFTLSNALVEYNENSEKLSSMTDANLLAYIQKLNAILSVDYSKDGAACLALSKKLDGSPLIQEYQRRTDLKMAEIDKAITTKSFQLAVLCQATTAAAEMRVVPTVAAAYASKVQDLSRALLASINLLPQQQSNSQYFLDGTFVRLLETQILPLMANDYKFGVAAEMKQVESAITDIIGKVDDLGVQWFKDNVEDGDQSRISGTLEKLAGDLKMAMKGQDDECWLPRLYECCLKEVAKFGVRSSSSSSSEVSNYRNYGLFIANYGESPLFKANVAQVQESLKVLCEGVQSNIAMLSEAFEEDKRAVISKVLPFADIPQFRDSIRRAFNLYATDISRAHTRIERAQLAKFVTMYEALLTVTGLPLDVKNSATAAVRELRNKIQDIPAYWRSHPPKNNEEKQAALNELTEALPYLPPKDRSMLSTLKQLKL